MNGNKVSLRVLGFSTKRNFENLSRNVANRKCDVAQSIKGVALEAFLGGLYVAKLHKCEQKRFLTSSTKKLISPIFQGGF